MSSSGKCLFFFLKKPFEKFLSPQRPSLQNQVSTVAVEMEKLDVIQESEKVEKLMLEQSISHTIVCNKMKKEYPGRDGNPPKMAVQGLSFAVPSGECFGMLGPNGAGKTSFINMAVEESLKSVNLLRGGVSDNPAGKYSGDGRLQCIGNPKELKGRYGGSYVLTMTTTPEHAKDVEMLVQDVSPNARKLYHIAGTQKFEIPKEEVRISQVFQAVEKAKRSFKVFAWGLADTTLEDVFIKVARSGQAYNVFS
ncbi:unnamed protein product [Brassica rapa]|uniref:ABC transporter domain-containing protein n=1 Tax=Brassica campestris TaxID=3711 RepID=A0A8D9GWX8_BRACM|nr:unnamed protein product [Brassica rapa]